MSEIEGPSLKEIFATQIDNLTALEPTTRDAYGVAVNSFLRFGRLGTSRFRD